MEFVVDVVALQPLEKVQQRVAEYRPRFSFGICGILRDAVFDVVADTLEQRVEQVFLIFEMPIERAARYAGGLGVFVPARFDGWDYKKDLVTVQSCMYNNAPEIETVSRAEVPNPPALQPV